MVYMYYQEVSSIYGQKSSGCSRGGQRSKLKQSLRSTVKLRFATVKHLDRGHDWKYSVYWCCHPLTMRLAPFSQSPQYIFDPQHGGRQTDIYGSVHMWRHRTIGLRHSLAAPPLCIERKSLASVVSRSCTTLQGFLQANQIAEVRDVGNLLWIFISYTCNSAMTNTCGVYRAIECAVHQLGYASLKSKQLKVLVRITEGCDVFVVLLTRYMYKSLCFACLPVVFDQLLIPTTVGHPSRHEGCAACQLYDGPCKQHRSPPLWLRIRMVMACIM